MSTDTIARNATWSEMAGRVLDGDAISRDEAVSILQAPDHEVLAIIDAAWQVRQRHFGQSVQLYYLKNAKSGLCPEDCGYCSQAKGSDAEIDKYPMLNKERLMDGARKAFESQARTYCIVASGRGPSDREVGSCLRCCPRHQRRIRTPHLRVPRIAEAGSGRKA